MKNRIKLSKIFVFTLLGLAGLFSASRVNAQSVPIVVMPIVDEEIRAVCDELSDPFLGKELSIECMELLVDCEKNLTQLVHDRIAAAKQELSDAVNQQLLTRAEAEEKLAQFKESTQTRAIVRIQREATQLCQALPPAAEAKGDTATKPDVEDAVFAANNLKSANTGGCTLAGASSGGGLWHLVLLTLPMLGLRWRKK